ncbi:TetR/AcrR family transcriptional regulator [Sporosarcina sp. CAU 1771]
MIERKQKVLLTAQRLFIEKGFSRTSVQEILDESNISKGTFYNYFSSKNECLVAILERARDEVTLRRRELLIGQDISDKDILSKQILARMQVTREYNLLPIFENAIHSEDSDLKTFVKNQHLAELSWLTHRLIDIYGDSGTPYAADCAVFVYGMMQQMLLAWKMDMQEMIDLTKLVPFIMRRIETIIVEMMDSQDAFLREDLFCIVEKGSVTKQDLIVQLSGFYNALEKDASLSGKECLQFLIEELHSEKPRTFLLESVVLSFREAFVETDYEVEAKGYVVDILGYVEMYKKKRIK